MRAPVDRDKKVVEYGMAMDCTGIGTVRSHGESLVCKYSRLSGRDKLGLSSVVMFMGLL